MKVRDVMTTSPKCCVPDDTASKAAKIMVDFDTGIVPVIESEQSRKLIGVVTDRDLCLAVVAGGLDPLTVQVRECMTSAVVCCKPDDPVQKAVDLMQENQVRRIAVVDDAGVIQGIVSMADITQRSHLEASTGYEALKTVSQPTEEASKPRARMRKSA